MMETLWYNNLIMAGIGFFLGVFVMGVFVEYLIRNLDD
mgnify:CR=1 FL=1